MFYDLWTFKVEKRSIALEKEMFSNRAFRGVFTYRHSFAETKSSTLRTTRSRMEKIVFINLPYNYRL